MSVDFIQHNSEAAASRKNGVSQSRPRWRTCWASDTRSWDLWAISLHKRPWV